MKIKDLKIKLEEYNAEADILLVVNNETYDNFEIWYGGADGCTKQSCDHICLAKNNKVDRCQ